MIPTCNKCQCRIWPPKGFCSKCFSDEITFTNVGTKGKILEFSKAYNTGTGDGKIFAFIEIGGIRLIGSVVGSRISKGKAVVLDHCGLGKDLEPFYDFIVEEENLPISEA
ncbi:MAG TPA: zinc ribbon domain-containing protein [Nitrososphaeraceae archaeon]|jgi:uncharacterized OB-fold protein